jgi:hypothetical protein
MCLLLVWCLVPVPPRLVAWTLMDRVQPGRTTLALGVTDLALLAASMRRIPGVAEKRWPVGLLLPAAVVWCGLVASLMWRIHAVFPGTPMTGLAAGATASGVVGLALLRMPRTGLAALVLLYIAATAGLNPVVRGGTRFLRMNPLSLSMKELDQAQRRRGLSPRWVVCGPTIGGMQVANLPRILGLHAINGVVPYPQVGLWRVLDPSGLYASAWNRYAHVAFVLPAAPGPTVIRNQGQDVVVVEMSPAAPEFRALGVTAVLYRGSDPERLRSLPGWRWVETWGDWHIFEIGSGPTDFPPVRRRSCASSPPPGSARD